MADQINTGRRQYPRASLHDRTHGLTAAKLGAGCLLLATACLGVIFWNPDLAVQSGAIVLGVSLAASGLLSLLAGDH